MGYTIVVTSGKGGTGKSTVTAACGTALALRGKSVLLIDCDWGLRCLDLMLGITSETVYDLGDIIYGNCDIHNAIYEVPGINGLYVIPAPNSVDYLNKADEISNLCKSLANDFDYIIIDCPAGVDKGFRAAVAPANLALVVVTPDAVSVRDAEKVGELLKRNGIKNQRLIINKFKRSVLRYESTKNLDKIIDSVSIQLIGVVPEDKNVQHLEALGQPIYGNSRAASAFRRIAARIEGEDVALPRIL